MERIRAWHDPDLLAEEVTRSVLKKHYSKRCAEVAVDTHRNELNEVKSFWRWCEEQSIVRRSPAEKIRPVGRRRRGKPQLRRSEARALFQAAARLAAEGDEGALATLAVLCLGIRSSELLKRRVRDVDVDRDGVLLWIDEGKTAAAVRHLEVPEPLAGLLAERVRGRAQVDWLWPAGTKTGHRRREWLQGAVRRLCRLAGVPRVTPHGLRGTWASLTSEAGVAAHIVSRELGHANQQITRQHYTRRGADERARTKRMLEVFEGGKTGDETVSFRHPRG